MTNGDDDTNYGATIREIFARITYVQPINDNERELLQKSIYKATYAMAVNESLLSDKKNVDAFLKMIENSPAPEMRISALRSMKMLADRGCDGELEIRLNDLKKHEKNLDVLEAIEKNLMFLREVRLLKIFELADTLPKPKQG